MRNNLLALLVGALILVGMGVYMLMSNSLGFEETTTIVTTTTVNGTVTITSVPVKARVTVEVLDEDNNPLVVRVFGLSTISGDKPRYLRISFYVPDKSFTAYPYWRLYLVRPIEYTTTTYTTIVNGTPTTTTTVVKTNTTQTYEPPPLPVPPTNTIYPLAIIPSDVEGLNGNNTLVVTKDLYKIFEDKQAGYYDLYVYFPVKIGEQVLLGDKYVRLTFKWDTSTLELLSVYVP